MRFLKLATMAAVPMLAAFASAAGAQEQPVCRDQETVDACHDRLVNGAETKVTLTKEVGAQLSALQRAQLNRVATGLNTDAHGLQSAIRDFVPRFSASALTPKLSAQGTDYSLNWNLPGAGAGTLQLGTVLHDAAVFPRLVSAVPSEQRPAVREQLEGRLGPFDDVGFSTAYNLESSRVGRNYDRYQTLLDSALAAAMSGLSGDAVLRSPVDQIALNRAYRAAIDFAAVEGVAPGRSAAAECGKAAVGERAVSCMTRPARARVEAALLPLATAERTRIQAVTLTLRGIGFDRLAQLVNNQPQVNVTGQYRVRTGAVGPDEWTAQARWETGLANMNDLRRFCTHFARTDTALLRRRQEDNVLARRIDTGILIPECLAAYAKTRENRLNRGDRLWASATATRRSPFQYTLTSPATSVDVAGAWQFEVSGGYGRYLNLAKAEDQRDRIDLQVLYREVRDDPLRENRFVASGSYTYRLTDNTSGTFGLTYANKPEFLGDVDRKFGGHIGVTLKLPQGKATK